MIEKIAVTPEDVSNFDDFDYVFGINYQSECKTNFINSYYSILPDFNSKDPILNTIEKGMKISGITFYYTNSKKIVTQYPIFIENDFSYNDILQELMYLEQTLYPLIIEKIIKNEQFEIKNLLKSSCNNNCKNCR